MKKTFIYTLGLLLAVSAIVASAPQVLAASVGPNNAGTGSNVAIGTNTDWSTPGNITAVGTPYAASTFGQGANTDYLMGTNYGFSIPAGATINGIQVVINRNGTLSVSTGVRDNAVYLVKNVSGSPVVQTSGNNKAKSTTWPTSFATDTYGSASDTWGLSWTADDINNVNFGVALSAHNNSSFSNRTATVDYMQITVTYTLPPLTVTINQASGQSDPAATSPVNFTVVFSQSVSNFATGDVTITGTAGGSKTATVTGSSTTYNVAVSGMTSNGTIIASIPAAVATDANGTANSASTFTDNTVTYNANGTIIVKKVMVGGTGTFDYTGTPNGAISANNGTISASVAAGQYTSTETLVTGWVLTSVTCNDNDSVGSVADHNAIFTVAAGETVTCTFTNTKVATLTVNKVVVPASDTGKFNLQIDGVTQAADVSNGGTTGAQVVSVGAHTVGELEGTDTTLTDYTSVISGACNASGNVTLTAGQNAVCTITNTKKGTITIQKNTVGADAVFSFNVTGPTPSSPSVSVTGGSGSASFLAIPGAYSIGENPMAGWSLTSFSCNGVINSNSFTLPAGGTITCIFNNTYQAPAPPLPQTCGIEVGLVGDTSGSVDNFELASLKTGLHNFTGIFLPGTPSLFSVTDFDTTAVIRQALTTDASLIGAGIDALSNGGNNQFTNWEDALTKAHTSFDSASTSKIIVLITDGDPFYKGSGSAVVKTTITDAVNAAIAAANNIKLANIRIVAIGIGTTNVDNTFGTDSVNVNNLIKIAGNTVSTKDTITADSDVITLATFDDLPAALTALATSVRSNTTSTCGGNITATKIIDADGNLQTTTDQTFAADWQFNIAGQDKTTGADGNTAAVAIGQGTYGVSETLPANYALISATCTGGANNGSLNGNMISGIQVGSLNAIACTFYNAPLGSIAIMKNVVPTQSLETFNFTATGGLSPANFTLQHGGSRVFSNLLPGTYGVTEDANQNYSSNVTCTDGVNTDLQSSALSINYGVNVTCSFINSDVTPPVITILGDNPATVAYSDVYVDAGASATDNVDASVTVLSSGSVDTNVIGAYTITYNASDAAGNAAIPVMRTVNVVKKDQTITFGTLSDKIYGDADFAVSASASSNLPVSFTTDSTACSVTDSGTVHIISIGNCSITASQAGNENYNAASNVNQSFNIGKKTINVTADANAKTYGDADPSLTYTNDALVGTDSFTGSLARDAGENVGSFAITQGDLALSGNYTLIYTGANLTIGQKTINVTADAKAKVFGEADPALTYIADPLVSGDAFTGSLTRDGGEDVGSYNITQGTLALSSDYILNYTGAKLTISLNPITVTADAKSKTYGDADPALTYVSSDPTVVFTGALDRVTGENVGTYAINQGTLSAGANYTITYVSAGLDVTAKGINVAANTQTKTYGDSDPALTYTADPLVGTDAFSGTLDRAIGEEVNTYAINQGTLTAGANYTITYTPDNLAITPKAITATAEVKTKTYGDADPSLTYTNDALVGSDSFTGSLTRDAGENIGDYAITQGTLALSGNYTLTVVPSTLTIGKKTINVTADANAKTYGDADPSLTYTNDALVGTDSFTGSLARDAGENVGSFAITQGDLALSGNYTLIYTGANLTIGQKTINVTADAKAKVFGEADPALTYIADPLVSGDAFTGSLTRDGGEDVGSYNITQGTLALSSDYILNYTGAKLTISLNPITVTADAKSKTYGDADPALTYVSSDPTVVFTGALDRVTGENVGTYAINQGTLSAGANYTITYVSAGLDVTAKGINVAANTQTKTYGDSDPALTYTADPLVGTDAFSGTLDRAIGEEVNTYAINQGTLTAGANYTITYTPDNLAITPKAITATAEVKTKTYGDADPSLTYTNDALVSGDSFTGSLTRDAGENIGDYAITQGTLALSGNYTLTVVPSTLTIGKKTINVTADANAKTYGDADPSLTYTNDALVGTDSFTGSLARDAGENVGSFAITQGDLALSGNYTLIYTGANLTIGQKTINVTADAKAKVFGEADPALTYIADPLVSGDAFTGSLTRDGGEDVGSYNITQGTLALSSDYILNYTGAKLTISLNPITVTADAKSKTYGDADPALTYVSSDPTVVFTGALDRVTGENVGTYAINQGTLSAGANYTITYVSAGLDVTAKGINVAANTQTKTYGDSDPALTYTADPLVGTDAFSGTLDRAIGEEVNTYAINQGTLTAGANYTITYTPDNLAITPKAITATAEVKTKTYGDADPSLTYTNDALVGSDSFTGSLTRDAGENIGDYAITQGTLALSGNYTLTVVPSTLTIGKKTINVTADANAKTYGDADPSLTYTNDALVGTDSFTGSLARDAGENVGSFAITQGDLALSGNYTLIYTGANLTIGQKTINVTADAKAKVFGEADPALTYIADPLVSGDAFTGSLTRDGGEDVGSYNITQGTLALSSDYILNYTGAKLTISLNPITVTADAKSKTYGDADPALTYVSSDPTVVFTGALDRVTGENVGTYAINQGTLSAGANYTITYVSAGLDVTAKGINVAANTQTKTYGDSDPALTYTADPLVGTDAFSGTLDRAIGEEVNTYAINQGTLTAGANYTITYTPDNLAITPKAITATAEVKTKTYGDADPSLTYTNDALVGSDSFTGSLTRDAGENIGDYAITQGTLALSGNYTLTVVPSTLTIGKKTINVTADANAKTYGDADPSLTYTNDALVGTDSFTGSLARDAGENVGSFAITQGDLALSGNYTLIYTGANLTIGQKTINVTADAKAKVFGEADPALTYIADPLVSGDAFTGSLTRDGGEDVGSYNITQGTLALSSDYILNYTGAKLTISLNPITVTADAKSKTYGDADPALTYVSSDPTVVFTGALDRVTGENVGTYAINQGTLSAGANYTITYVSAGLDVTAKGINVAANTQTKTYGDSDPALTYTADPLVGTDAFSGTLDRAIGEEVNTYAINQGTLTAGANYTITYTPDNLAITPKAITATAEVKTKTYGDADPSLTYTNDALVGSDSFTGSLTRDAGENIGDYAITQGTLALSGNYTLTVVPSTLTIGKKTINVTADANAKTYGDADPSLTYTNDALVGTDSFTGSLARDAGENVGSFAITQGDLALSGNYTLIYTGANLTIGQKTINVTADAKAKVFGEADPALTYIADPLVSGDAFTGSLTRDGGEDVGSYNITQGTLALSSDYILNYTGAKLTISLNPITVTADAKSKTYGDADPALTYVSSDPTVVFTGALDRVTGENVGTYAINQGTLSAGANYTITYVSAGLDVTAKGINVAANTQTKTYGDSDPALTYTADPLVGTDAFSGTLDRAIGEEVNTYAINQGSLTAGTNYTITYTGADLTITQTTLTVKADNKNMAYGNSDPEFTKSYSGYKNGDDETVLNTYPVASVSVPHTALGQYDITVSGGLDNNYNFTYATGTLTITDETNPVISLIGTSTMHIAVGATFTDPGATATDNHDGDISSHIATTTNVNTAIAGNYYVNYDVADNSGNEANQVSRAVIVSVLQISEQHNGTVSTDSVVIHWTTSHPATSRVIYGTVSISDASSTAAGPLNYGYANSTTEDTTLVTSHSVTVGGLNAGTVYYFRSVSHGSPETIGAEVFVTTGVPAPVGGGGGGGGGGYSTPVVTPVVATTTTATTTKTTTVEPVKVLGTELIDYSTYTSLYGLRKELVEAITLDEAQTIYSQTKMTVMDKASQNVYNKVLKSYKGTLTDKLKFTLSYFIQTGTPTTKILGAGERGGVVDSYLAAFGRLPGNVEEWRDALKIANGRWPNARSAQAEANAAKYFLKVYRRSANLSNANDQAAITIIAYGLRSANRNMNSEKQAIKSFKAIFTASPTTALDWDIVRAIAYSGAKR